MERIFKYQLAVTDTQTIPLPVGAQPLHVEAQGKSTPCVWALIDDTQQTEARTFRIYGTGDPVDRSDAAYVGTFQLLDGQFVGHVYLETAA